MLLGGLALSAVGLRVGGRRVRRTRYRPDVWRRAEWLVLSCGVVPMGVSFFASSVDANNLNPSLDPLTWPQLPLLASLGVLVAAIPAWATPQPPPASTSEQAVPDEADPTSSLRDKEMVPR